MSKKPAKSDKVSTSDAAEFRAAIDAIPDKLPPLKPLADKAHNKDYSAFRYPEGFNPDYPTNWLKADASYFWRKQDLNSSQVSRLKRGQITIAARCDLHNLTVPEADAAVASFLQSALAKNSRCVMIICAKGNANKPILKNWLLAYLKTQPQVLAFCTASKQHGGNGAFYVLLKNTGKQKWVITKT